MFFKAIFAVLYGKTALFVNCKPFAVFKLDSYQFILRVYQIPMQSGLVVTQLFSKFYIQLGGVTDKSIAVT